MSKMYLFSVPDEAMKHHHPYSRFEDIPDDVFSRIKTNFSKLQADAPLISVNIIAYNEEENILKTLSSLSEIRSKYPVEVVVVDNNSTDKTSDIISKCGLEPVKETKQGYGFAREAAVQKSKGKYILTGDSDTIYLPGWVDALAEPMIRNEAIASFGSYAFIPPADKSRFSYALYEKFRNLGHVIKRFKRPHLTVVGMNFGFPRTDAMEIGFVRENVRGEDGRMAFALASRGKVKYIGGYDATVWTHHRSLRSNGVMEAFITRAQKEIKRLYIYFYRYKE